MQKKTRTLISVVVVILIILGGWYLYASHSVSSHVPGHVYQYSGVSDNQNAYMTFDKASDKAVVTPDKSTALKANKSSSNFDSVYQSQADQGKWNYKAKGSKLTLSKNQDGKISMWQYNNVLVFGKKMHSSSFTYQIANAGQGVDHKSTNFTRVK